MIWIPAQQVTKHGMSRIVQGFQMSNFDVFFQYQMRKVPEKTARIASTHDQTVTIR